MAPEVNTIPGKFQKRAGDVPIFKKGKRDDLGIGPFA